LGPDRYGGRLLAHGGPTRKHKQKTQAGDAPDSSVNFIDFIVMLHFETCGHLDLIRRNGERSASSERHQNSSLAID
jgi:hypothetical protein